MWHMITETMTNEDGVSYTAYGFRCGDYIIHDMTSLPDEAESFLEILNSFEVSTLHAADIIEDHFAQL